MDTSTTLPTLTGSTRQIEWASEIRRETLTQLDAFAGILHPGNEHVVQALRDIMSAETSAEQWISVRDDLKTTRGDRKAFEPTPYGAAYVALALTVWHPDLTLTVKGRQFPAKQFAGAVIQNLRKIVKEA